MVGNIAAVQCRDGHELEASFLDACRVLRHAERTPEKAGEISAAEKRMKQVLKALNYHVLGCPVCRRITDNKKIHKAPRRPQQKRP
jgi:hypothetical protein